MLDLLRRKAQSFGIQIIIVLIALVFVFLGVNINQNSKANIVATVDDTTVSFDEFRKQYNQILSQQRERFGGNIPEDLLTKLVSKQQVLDQIVYRILLDKGALESGVHVSNKEVQKMVGDMEFFKNNGAFDLETYEKLLARQRISPKDYETGLKSDLLAQKTQNYLNRFAKVTPSMLEDRFAYEYEELTLEYFILDADAFKQKVKVDDDGLAAFYEKNSSKYKTAPEVTLSYLLFPFGDKEATDKSQTFKKANDVYTAIIGTGSLKKYAEENDAKIEKTGYFSRQKPPAAFNEEQNFLNTAFKLKKEELSSIIELKKGFAILFVDDIKQPQIPPLEQVKDEVKKDYIAAEAKILAQKAADDALAALKGGAEFQGEAKKLGAQVKKTEPFSRAAESSKELPTSIVEGAFKLTENNPYPAEIGVDKDKFYVYKLSERKQPPAELFNEKKDALKQQLIRQKQSTLLTSWLDGLKKEADISINEQLLQ